MDTILLNRTWISGQPVQVDNLMGTAFTGEAGAHTFIIAGKDAYGNDVPITGQITAKFLASNQVTVPLVGSIGNDCAFITLSDTCYLVPGRFVLSIFATNGNYTTCIYCGVGNVFATSSDIAAYPTMAIPDLNALIQDVQAAISSVPADYSALINSIASTFDPEKSGGYGVGEYVWYNGLLYRFKEPHTGGWQASHVDQVILANDLTSVAAVASAGVRYDIGQGLSDTQKATARENINAQEALTIDAAPTEGSTNPVQSGGVYSEVSDLRSAIDEDVALLDGKISMANTRITGNATNIGTLQTDMENAQRDIRSLDGEYIDLSVRMGMLEPEASEEDVGKALIVKTVGGNKVTEYEFGETTEIDDTAGEGDTDKTWSADKLSKIKPGLSDAAIEALLACFRHVAWVDEHGQDCYDALESALYPGQYPKIMAVYSPGSHVVWDTDSLDSLKTYLVVTYYEEEGSSGTVIASSNYSLFGTLTAGESTILVTYGALNTTFTVNVSTHTIYALPANTVFDGTGESPIITDVKLMDSNKTYSIVLKGKLTLPSDSTVTQTIMQIRDQNNGVALSCGLFPSTKRFSVGSWSKSTVYESPTDFAAGDHTFKIALSHVAGATTQLTALVFDGHPSTSKNNAYDYVAGNHTLVIGAGYNANVSPYTTNQRMTGLLEEFKVFDYAMLQSELDAYVA